MKRRPPTKDEKLVAVMLMVPGLVPENLRNAAVGVVLAAYEWHHETPVALGGVSTPHNLTPLLACDHRERTRHETIPMIARSKRIVRKHGEHVTRMAELKLGIVAPPDPVAMMRERVLAGPYGPRQKPKKRKIQGRGFQGWRTFDGSVRWKKDQRRKGK